MLSEGSLSNSPVILSDQAYTQLSSWLQAQTQLPVLLVADANTFAAAGSEALAALRAANATVKHIVLEGYPQVAAHEENIVQVLTALDGNEHLLIALGAGTITDITRFAAFQTRLPYLSLPTAASVDAYTSFTAAITLREVKHSLLTKPAAGVFAHLPVLCAAPPELTASGYGDMLAKFTALADWQIAHLVTGEAYNAAITAAMRQAAQNCADQSDEIAARTETGVTTLMQSLLLSGESMVQARSSRPAAGAEHSLSHFWEINHARCGLPAALHGQKTGVATAIIARLYENLRSLSATEAARRLERFTLPDEADEIARIRQSYGSLGDMLIASRPSLLGTLRRRIGEIKTRIVHNWDDIQAVAALVPTQAQITTLLMNGGAPHQPDQINVQPDEVRDALRCAMYVRDRLTILELSLMLEFSEGI